MGRPERLSPRGSRADPRACFIDRALRVRSAVSGDRSGLTNGVIPVFGTVNIPAAHTDFGTYTATLTATTALD